MPKMYVEFKTWTDGGFDVPWPFVQFEETDDWRKREDPYRKLDKSAVKAAFLSFNEDVCNRFLEDHINAVILGTVLDALDEKDVFNKITKIFGYCEILGITSADDDRVVKIMEGAK